MIWPGGTTKLPQDVLRLDPKNISIGWVIESAWATPVSEQESRMYAQQAVDEINDDLFLLPNTFLTLEVETVMNNAKTVEAHNAVEARATDRRAVAIHAAVGDPQRSMVRVDEADIVDPRIGRVHDGGDGRRHSAHRHVRLGKDVHRQDLRPEDAGVIGEHGTFTTTTVVLGVADSAGVCTALRALVGAARSP